MTHTCKRDISNELLSALVLLRLEALHYRQTGIGGQFLDQAIDKATRLIVRPDVMDMHLTEVK